MNQIAASWRSQPARRQGLFVWLTLAALFLQSLLVQTHLHLPSGPLPVSARSQISFNAASFERSSPAGHSTCPLCIELKIAGHYLPPTPLVLAAPTLLTFWFHHGIAAEPNRPQPTHHWQSRAPPNQP